MEFEDRVTFLPAIGPTETLYSISARLHRLRGNGPSASTSRWLYGCNWAANQHDIPASLNNFVRVTRGLLGTPAEMLFGRTVAGLYLRFMDSARATDIASSFNEASGSRSKFKLGLHSSRLPSQHPLRLCPNCVRQDRDTFGSGIWRIEHQLPAVYVCVHHDLLLRQPIGWPGPTAKEWQLPNCLVTGAPVAPIGDAEVEFWKEVAATTVFFSRMKRVDRGLLRGVLKQSMVEREIIRTINSLNTDKLAAWASSRGLGKAVAFSPEISSLGSGNWIRDLLLGRRVDHPTRWAVLAAMVMSCAELEDALNRTVGLQATIFGSWVDPAIPRPDLLPKIRSSVATGSIDRMAKEALRLNPSVRAQYRDDKENFRFEAARARILEFLRTNRTATRTKLFVACNSDVKWLQRHRPDWLTANLPVKKKGLTEAVMPDLFDQTETR